MKLLDDGCSSAQRRKYGKQCNIYYPLAIDLRKEFIEAYRSIVLHSSITNRREEYLMSRTRRNKLELRLRPRQLHAGFRLP